MKYCTPSLLSMSCVERQYGLGLETFALAEFAYSIVVYDVILLDVLFCLCASV